MDDEQLPISKAQQEKSKVVIQGPKLPIASADKVQHKDPSDQLIDFLGETEESQSSTIAQPQPSLIMKLGQMKLQTKSEKTFAILKSENDDLSVLSERQALQQTSKF